MPNIDLSPYMGKIANSEMGHEEWNALMQTLQTSINGGAQDAAFYVNGEVVTPSGGIVSLPSKGRNVLSGTLAGRVQIGSVADVFDASLPEPTQIILAGVTIMTDHTDNAAIEYLPEAEKMLVTVRQGTVNRLICTHEAPRADSQKGALHCANDMIIQGTGQLDIINHGGHGVKASELRINGRPLIYVEAVHDGFHGNKLIGVTGGLLYVNGANDAFGTRAESGTVGAADYKSPGKIWLFGGEFYAYNIGQKVFDSKDEGCIFVRNRVMNTKDNVVNTQATGITLHTDATESNQYAGLTVCDPETYFGTPVVTGATLGEDGETYTATAKAVTVKGYFSGKRFVFPLQQTEVTLQGAYIEYAGTAPVLSYTYDGKNIKVTSQKETVNVIAASALDGVCIGSVNNIAVEPKNNSYLLLRGGATAMQGSEVTVRDGFGSVMADSAVIGSQVIFGEAGKVFGGSLTTPLIHARLSGKGQKGNCLATDATFIGSVVADALHTDGMSTITGAGTFCCDEMSGATIMGHDVPPGLLFAQH